MPATDDGPGGSGRRWWEIRGRRDSDEGGYGHLVTGARGRVRPERSLSVGADPVLEEPPSRWRSAAWLVGSLVVAGALVGGGVYAVPKLTSSSTSTEGGGDTVAQADSNSEQAGSGGNGSSGGDLPALSVPQGGGGDAGGSGGGGGTLPPLRLGGVPRAPAPDSGGNGYTGGGVRSGGGFPGGAGQAQSGNGATSSGNGSGSGSSASRGSTSGLNSQDAADVQAEPDSGADANNSGPAIELEGPAPAAPGRQQGGRIPEGSGGCQSNTCTLAQSAPVYLAGTSKPRARAPARSYTFLCQTEGSSYSVNGQSGNWWAWFGRARVGVWVPVVYLEGASGGGEPVPGLRICDTGSASTSSTGSTSSGRSGPSATSSAGSDASQQGG